MKVRNAFLVLARKLQEAADASLTSSDVAGRLQDEIQDMHRNTGHWANYHDHIGDDKSGDVIYSVDGNTVKAPYEISGGGDTAAKTFIHSDKAQNVVPRTVYEPEANQDELDQYAMMVESKLYTRGPVPLIERNIPKSERDAADSGSFAGKGKSFPILKAEDVGAAAHALGRAGSDNYSTDVIKKNIIRIAKKNGWTAQLPKAWQDGGSDAKESLREADATKCPKCNGLGKRGKKDCPKCDGSGKMAEAAAKKKTVDCASCDGDGDCSQCDGDGEDDAGNDCPACDGSGDCSACDGDGSFDAMDTTESHRGTGAGGSLKIREMTSRPSDAALDLIESAAGSSEMEIKLIAPGKGSSAFYTPEALKQAAADKVFDKGCHVYINHATRAEESERPEGDWHKLVGALSKPAYWVESHKQGPGLYSKVSFASDMAPIIREKAPYTGMSIRANGDAVMESSGRPVLREGVPVLKKFTSAESVDIVTRAGAGGMILTESAPGAKQPKQEADSMTLQEAQRLIEQAVKPLRERTVKADAREEGTRLLEAVSLPDAAKHRIIERCLEHIPTAGNELDVEKFREQVVKEAQSEGRYLAQLTGGFGVSGMGIATEPAPDPKEAQRLQEAQKVREAGEIAVFNELMGNETAAKLAAKGRVN